jgi:hypothetical protein
MYHPHGHGILANESRYSTNPIVIRNIQEQKDENEGIYTIVGLSRQFAFDGYQEH